MAERPSVQFIWVATIIYVGGTYRSNVGGTYRSSTLSPGSLLSVAEAFVGPIGSSSPGCVISSYGSSECERRLSRTRLAGELRLAIHAGDRDLISLAELVGTTPIYLSRFFAGDPWGVRTP